MWRADMPRSNGDSDGPFLSHADLVERWRLDDRRPRRKKVPGKKKSRRRESPAERWLRWLRETDQIKYNPLTGKHILYYRESVEEIERAGLLRREVSR